uniref:Uncharacterized protein n=1 Tax=Cacopsylla melanoneura TaxID=428564 RepID=A0A8D9B345_9HEMI
MLRGFVLIQTLFSVSVSYCRLPVRLNSLMMILSVTFFTRVLTILMRENFQTMILGRVGVKFVPIGRQFVQFRVFILIVLFFMVFMFWYVVQISNQRAILTGSLGFTGIFIFWDLVQNSL